MKEHIQNYLEIKAYVHAGVSVLVEIDYDEGTIALLDNAKSNDRHYAPKKWVFAGRTIDYMAGWQNILDAMKHAVEQAEKSLKKHQDAKDKEMKAREMRLIKAIAEHKD